MNTQRQPERASIPWHLPSADPQITSLCARRQPNLMSGRCATVLRCPLNKAAVEGFIRNNLAMKLTFTAVHTGRNLVQWASR
jgi:hypothetical protein